MITNVLDENTNIAFIVALISLHGERAGVRGSWNECMLKMIRESTWITRIAFHTREFSPSLREPLLSKQMFASQSWNKKYISASYNQFINKNKQEIRLYILQVSVGKLWLKSPGFIL